MSEFFIVAKGRKVQYDSFMFGSAPGKKMAFSEKQISPPT